MNPVNNETNSMQPTPVQPVTAQPVQVNQPTPVVPEPPVVEKSHKGMIIAAIGIAVIVLIIFGVVGYMYIGANNKQTANAPTAYVAPTAIPTPTVSAEVKAASTQVKITSSADLNKLLNEVNTASTSSLEQDYSQAAVDASSL